MGAGGHLAGEEPPGTRAGHDLPLRSGKTVTGVVGVTGNPEDITSIAQGVQLATQLLIEHAAEQDASDRRQAADRGLITALLLGEDGPPALQRQLDAPGRRLPVPWQLAALLPRDSCEPAGRVQPEHPRAVPRPPGQVNPG